MKEKLLLGAAAAVLALTGALVASTRSQEGCAAYTATTAPLVAHAGGGLPDRFYANNLAALNLAAKHGHTLVELDFIERHGRLLLGHDDDNLSDLTLRTLIEWLDRHSQVSVITDIKSDNLSGLALIKAAAGDRLAQFIPQIYQPAQLAPAKALGFSRIIFAERVGESRDWYPWVNTADLWAVTIPKGRAGLEIHHPVFLYTVNEPVHGFGLYTDCLIPA